ncbi:hypothetical protein [Thermogymnomonas acidicola]|uniref:hypothetical protein n=1 Tax=Thermogymnomonas acidicola TaxID=399579 RepID=UPI0013967D4F|nr:hypothetical protein [Thermogymnomonas acidicola]
MVLGLEGLESNCGWSTDSLFPQAYFTPLVRLQDGLHVKMENCLPGNNAVSRALQAIYEKRERRGGEARSGMSVRADIHEDEVLSFLSFCFWHGLRPVIAPEMHVPGGGLEGAVMRGRDAELFLDLNGDEEGARAYYRYTGVELWSQAGGGEITDIVVPVRDGRIISGLGGAFFRERNENIRIVAVLQGGERTEERFGGIRRHVESLPPALNPSVIDRSFTVSPQDAERSRVDLFKSRGGLISGPRGGQLRCTWRR